MSPGGSGVRWLSCGALGERDQRSEFRFCTRATRSKNADRRPQRPRPSSYLSAGDSHRLFECSPKSNPRETDRKRQAITVYPRQVIYFFPTRPPGCLWGARLAPRACPGHVLQAAGGREQRVGVCPTSARSSSRPARTCVQRVPVGGAGQGQERAWSGGTLCLAQPTLHTGSSGVQGAVGV